MIDETLSLMREKKSRRYLHFGPTIFSHYNGSCTLRLQFWRYAPLDLLLHRMVRHKNSSESCLCLRLHFDHVSVGRRKAEPYDYAVVSLVLVVAQVSKRSVPTYLIEIWLNLSGMTIWGTWGIAGSLQPKTDLQLGFGWNRVGDMFLESDLERRGINQIPTFGCIRQQRNALKATEARNALG